MQTGYAVPWLLVITVMLCLSVRPVAAEEPFRVVTPAGSTCHPAVLIVPRCSGFVAANGLNLYEERAPELRAVGYVVVLVDYIGRRMQMNFAFGYETNLALTQREYLSSVGRMVAAVCLRR